MWSFDGSTLFEVLRLSADDLATGARAVSFSPDGDRLAVSDWHALSTKIFDVSELGGGELFNLESEPRTGGAITDDQVVTVGRDGFIRTTDLSTGSELLRLDEPQVGGLKHFAEVDPAGQRVAVQPFDESTPTGGGDEVEIRDLADGRVHARLDVSDGTWISALAWSGDGSFVVVAKRPTGSQMDSEIVVYDAESGARLATLRLPSMGIGSLTVAPDGTSVAFAQSYNPRFDPTRIRVKIWDWKQNEVGTEVPINASSLAFDPSGTRLAVTRIGNGHAEILDTETGAIVTTLSGSTAPLNAVAFSADGSAVVTGGQDGAVRIWDSRTGEERLLLDAGRAVSRVGLDPSGKRLLSLDDSGAGASVDARPRRTRLDRRIEAHPLPDRRRMHAIPESRRLSGTRRFLTLSMPSGNAVSVKAWPPTSISSLTPCAPGPGSRRDGWSTSPSSVGTRSTGASSRCGSSTRRTRRSGTRPSIGWATTGAIRVCGSPTPSVPAVAGPRRSDVGTRRSARRCTSSPDETRPLPTSTRCSRSCSRRTGSTRSLVKAADDESHDDHIRADTELALTRTGGDVGTPILTFHPGAEQEASFFGPVISKAPTGEEALTLWDAVETLATMSGMAELKRSNRAAPDFT